MEEGSKEYYRYGWCGFPTDSEGTCLELEYDEATKYIGDRKEVPVEHTNGACCQSRDDLTEIHGGVV